MKKTACKHKNADWPYCEQCEDESWCCYDCGKSACRHDRSDDVSPCNDTVMNKVCS